MGGATLAKVQLDRVGRPRSGVVLHHNEVHREPAERAELCEPSSDHHRGLCDGRGVVGIGREHAAEILLAARATEKLVVGRQQFNGAVRQCPHLDTRTGQRFAGDPLLDDAAVLLEGREIDVDS